jgi:DNA polymerase III sliding clamp (beta) subunit (PCNA family)
VHKSFLFDYVDIREESSVGFLFGKIFKIINKCPTGVKTVAQSHGSAMVIASEHNRLQNIRINKNITPMGATVGTSCQEIQLNVF